MEPWFGNHGNNARPAVNQGFPGASMEPWFGNHGNLIVQGGVECSHRGFNGAVVR